MRAIPPSLYASASAGPPHVRAEIAARTRGRFLDPATVGATASATPVGPYAPPPGMSPGERRMPPLHAVGGLAGGGLSGTLRGTATLKFPERESSLEQRRIFICGQMLACEDEDALAAIKRYIIRNRLNVVG